MTLDDKPVVMPDIYSFKDVLDKACDELMDKHVNYSIRRIQEMEEFLILLERELDEFLARKDR